MLANQITHIAFVACKTSYKVSHFTRHKSHLSGFEKKKGGAWGVSDRSIGALKILPRSPEPHLFGAWSPNVILLQSLEPSKSLLQSPESQILAFKHANTPEYSGSLLVDHALVINVKVVKS